MVTSEHIIEIDGSIGGGQVLRTALAVSMAIRTGFHITNIRKKREKDGLMRQHLTCVNACAQICNARVYGAEFRSTEVTFIPDDIKNDNYSFNIGTGGSIALILQAIACPLSLRATKGMEITIKGGTFCPNAPSTAFLKRTLLPCLEAMGYGIDIIEDKAGFYTSGGGIIRMTVSKMTETKPLAITQSIKIKELKAHILNIRLDESIGRRELLVLKNEFPKMEVDIIRQSSASGCGNAIYIIADDSNQRKHVFSTIGMPHLKAETLAYGVCEEVKQFINEAAPCSHHLADQLLVPLTLSKGGRFIMGKPDSHFESCRRIISRFTNKPIEVVPHDNDTFMVEVPALENKNRG